MLFLYMVHIHKRVYLIYMHSVLSYIHSIPDSPLQSHTWFKSTLCNVKNVTRQKNGKQLALMQLCMALHCISFLFPFSFFLSFPPTHPHTRICAPHTINHTPNLSCIKKSPIVQLHPGNQSPFQPVSSRSPFSFCHWSCKPCFPRSQKKAPFFLFFSSSFFFISARKKQDFFLKKKEKKKKERK